MPSIHEQFSTQFSAWERRCRGWQIFPAPVKPEPPFSPFLGYAVAPVIDDGRRPTALSSFVARLSRRLAKTPEPAPASFEEESEPEPTPLVRGPLIELRTTLPSGLNIAREAFEAFLSNLKACVEPVSFELIALEEKVSAQFVAHPQDAPLLKRQVSAYFPEASFIPNVGSLNAFSETDTYQGIVEFGLSREIFYPLASGKIDPFIGIVGALGELRPSERAVFQVLFQPCEKHWASSLMRALTDAEGGARFVNAPQYVMLAKEKTSRPLYAAVVRIAAQSESFEDTWEILRNLAGAMRVFAHPTGNELIPLNNEGYPGDAHLEDLLRRQTRRSGMLLNLDELIGFVHFPSSAVRTRGFQRQTLATKAAPRTLTGSEGLILGENTHLGETRVVRLSPEQRTKHIYTIGVSGTGKSTLLFNLIRQDIEAGEGFALLDPHGDLVDRVLGCIPEHRVKDVILVDPSDETASIGFNVLVAHSDLEKTLLASDLVAVFRRLSTSWGDQMEGVIRNAILAFLESSRGGTLSDLQRFLLDPRFREAFLETVHDQEIQFYWRKGFTQLGGNKSVGSAVTRLNEFLSTKPLRYMVAQRHNRLDFGSIMDSKKILLAKLSQGAMGTENLHLLGSLLMAKFQQTAMARQNQEESRRQPFWIYADEFQNFITPSMAEILSGARKYRVGLILAHQELRHLEKDREVASAVLSNPYTRVVFRVGDADARTLEQGFSSFKARDLQNLGTGEAIVRVERSESDFNLSVPLPVDPDPSEAARRRNQVIEASRRAYAPPRAQIEAELRKQFEGEASRDIPPAPKPATKKPDKERPATEASASPPAEPMVAPPPSPVSKVELKSDPAEPLPKDVPTVSEPKPPADLGRGGNQHQEIQKRLKEAAQQLGYLVTAEKPVLDRTGSVDLALEQPNRTIAVEITVTTTIDHEVGNVLKCLRADFQTVAVVSSSETKLKQMKEAVAGAIVPERSTRVGYFSPDQFIDHLQRLAREDGAAVSPSSMETNRRGYKVRRSAPKLTPEELKVKEAAALRMVAETMKQPFVK